MKKNDITPMYEKVGDIILDNNQASFDIGGERFFVVNAIDDIKMRKHKVTNQDVLAIGTHYSRKAKHGENNIFATFYGSLFKISKQQEESRVLINIEDIIKVDFIDGEPA